MQAKKTLLISLGLLALGTMGVAAANPVHGNAASQELPRIDKVVVYKGERRLELWHKAERVKSYRISLGQNPIGHKQREGDSRTPEGDYTIDWRNPKSRFHKSLHISYPNAEDKARARAKGVSPGGDIMIHGLPNSMDDNHPDAELMSQHDWTDGCIAVKNRDIEEIWKAVPDGTPITLYP